MIVVFIYRKQFGYFFTFHSVDMFSVHNNLSICKGFNIPSSCLVFMQNIPSPLIHDWGRGGGVGGAYCYCYLNQYLSLYFLFVSSLGHTC